MGELIEFALLIIQNSNLVFGGIVLTKKEGFAFSAMIKTRNSLSLFSF